VFDILHNFISRIFGGGDLFRLSHKRRYLSVTSEIKKFLGRQGEGTALVKISVIRSFLVCQI
jgi:hypothetical protein